jgi:hypothetical protein
MGAAGVATGKAVGVAVGAVAETAEGAPVEGVPAEGAAEVPAEGAAEVPAMEAAGVTEGAMAESSTPEFEIVHVLESPTPELEIVRVLESPTPELEIVRVLAISPPLTFEQIPPSAIQAILDVKDDGHCGFRALAISIYGEERRWRKVKTMMLKTFEDNVELYRGLLG